MRYSKYDIVFQEVPDEISLCFYAVGCPLNCIKCHSAEFKYTHGIELTIETYEELLNRYKSYITCVLFLGGDWFDDINQYLILAKENNLHTCLYTGYNDIELNTKQHLTYLKTGPYVESLGGLTSRNTNQKFYNIDTNTDETFKFWR